MAPEKTVRHHTCSLCEANCNLALTVEGDRVTEVRGDRDDCFSQGFICPKGPAIAGLHHDPDRLRAPQIREGSTWRDGTYEEAFALVEKRLLPIIEKHGPNAVGVYLGNPSAHHISLGLYSRFLLKALKTQNVFSASTLDQMPKQVSAGLMFGNLLSIPIPDVDHTDYLLMLGANPVVSNGSLMTAPNMRKRMRDIRDRGGKVVVVDPRRSKSADEADEHLAVRPGGDAFFLAAIAHTLIEENLAKPGDLAAHAAGAERIPDLVAPFSPEAIEAASGIDPTTIRRIARELAAAPTAAVYGRIGTCTQEFGTLSSWLVDVVNYLTGNLDRPGGALFTHAAVSSSGPGGKGRGVKIGRWTSRVRKAPEAYGEISSACLREEIETPGEGQIRALITVAGNPVLSSAAGAQLSDALGKLEFMVSLDIYRNETTRNADVIFPGLSPLEQSHYPTAFTQLSVRNFARYSPPVFEAPQEQMPEWQVLLKLMAIVSGQGSAADPDVLDDFVFSQLLERSLGNAHSPIHARPAEEIQRMVSRWRGPERLLDLTIRTGPHGDGFGANPGGLSIASLAATPHAVDLGPLQPRLPEVLRTPSGKMELAPPAFAADMARMEARLAETTKDDIVLVGRRQLRSNNSWMHNIPSLVSGKARCTLHVHPDDAGRLGLTDGGTARISSRAGTVEAPVETTDGIRPGVVSLPHGWGHHYEGTTIETAKAHAGVSSNDLTDPDCLDPLSGNVVLNGIPVTVAPA